MTIVGDLPYLCCVSFHVAVFVCLSVCVRVRVRARVRVLRTVRVPLLIIR